MDIITNTQSDNNAVSLKSTFQLLSTFHLFQNTINHAGKLLI